MKYYSGSLRITNPATLQKWKDDGKYQELIDKGYKYAIGCGRFRMEECTCSKCRKRRIKKSYTGHDMFFANHMVKYYEAQSRVLDRSRCLLLGREI